MSATTTDEFLAEQKRLAYQESRGATQRRHRLAEGMQIMIAALEAVTAAHRSVDVEPSETVCHGCSTLRGTGENARYFPYEEWPCPTIRAIEAALGGEGE